MKKFFALTAVLVLLTSTSAFAVISGSGHDFTVQTWTADICAPCHTPHNAITGAGPLWSHTTSTQTFTLYSSPTFDGSGTITQPTGVSLACLSCHDGVTNVDGFIGSTPNGLAGSAPMGAISANLGIDLSNDHPISFVYDAALVALDGGAGLVTPLSASEVTAGGMPLFTASLECATCHDVHNGFGFPSLLRETPVGSAICLTCHTK